MKLRSYLEAAILIGLIALAAHFLVPELGRVAQSSMGFETVSLSSQELNR